MHQALRILKEWSGDSPARHICIAGNIGAGKSTLAGALGRALDATVLYEDVEDNRFLADFYTDPERWSLAVQVAFLGQAAEQHLRIAASGGLHIQDRSIYEHHRVFMASLHEQGRLSGEEYRILSRLAGSLEGSLRPPDLVLHLRAPVTLLATRIAERGREMERAVTPGYLSALEGHYASLSNFFRSAGPSAVWELEAGAFDAHDPHQMTELADRISGALLGSRRWHGSSGLLH